MNNAQIGLIGETAVKLKLLERKSCFEKEKGKAEFGRLFQTIQQRVYSL